MQNLQERTNRKCYSLKNRKMEMLPFGHRNGGEQFLVLHSFDKLLVDRSKQNIFRLYAHHYQRLNHQCLLAWSLKAAYTRGLICLSISR